MKKRFEVKIGQDFVVYEETENSPKASIFKTVMAIFAVFMLTSAGFPFLYGLATGNFTSYEYVMSVGVKIFQVIEKVIPNEK